MLNKILTIDGRKLVFFILYFTLIMETLIAELHLPEFIRYFNDIAILMLLVVFMPKKLSKVIENNKLVCYGIVIFLLICICSAVINFVPTRLVVWALRNTFRGIIYFLACIIFLKKEDLPKIFNILFKFQILNLVLSLYQFFILHHEMDQVRGMFGYSSSAGVEVFNALISAYYLNAYLAKKEKLTKLLFVILSSFIIAAIAEVKFTYVLFVVIFCATILLTKFSVRKLLAVMIGVVGLTFGLILMKYYYPVMYEVLVDTDSLMSYATSTHEEGYRIPRIGAFKVISKELLNNNTKKELIGIGFGNGETSSLKIFQSSFYKQYGDWNYRWFAHQWIFLETGYIGFISFLCIFLFMLKDLMKYLKDVTVEQKYFVCTSIAMILCCILSIWKNAALKLDAQYIMYFALAIGFIVKNSQKGELT